VEGKSAVERLYLFSNSRRFAAPLTTRKREKGSSIFPGRTDESKQKGRWQGLFSREGKGERMNPRRRSLFVWPGGGGGKKRGESRSNPSEKKEKVERISLRFTARPGRGGKEGSRISVGQGGESTLLSSPTSSRPGRKKRELFPKAETVPPGLRAKSESRGGKGKEGTSCYPVGVLQKRKKTYCTVASWGGGRKKKKMGRAPRNSWKVKGGKRKKKK